MPEKLNVLLIIDNIQSARHLTALLEEAGYSVGWSSLSQAGKTDSVSAPPDLIVFDTLLLDDEEWGLFHRLRRERDWTDVPVLAIATLLDGESRKKIRSLGADELIAKPIEPTELLVKIRSALRFRACERQVAKRDRPRFSQQPSASKSLTELSQIAATQASQESLESILVELLRQTKRLIHFDEGMICTEVQPGRYGVLVHVGGGKCDLASFYEAGVSYTGWMVLHRQPLLVADVEKESRVRMLGREQGLNKALNSFVGLPLISGDQIVGTLELASYRRAAFDASAIDTLRPVAQIALVAMENARLQKNFAEQVDTLRGEILRYRNQWSPVFESQTMERLMRIVQKVKDSSCPVLITGETGVGKELIARFIHFGGNRWHAPFVDVNCAAIPESLQESELFGIEKGTATGVDKRVGKFEFVGSGTFFLDEVADMPAAMQAKMLRVLQERTFERLGANEKLHFRGRVIAATSRDIAQAIREGRFREELYYRLAVVHLHIPSLRERPEDIPPLVRHFVRMFCSEQGRPHLNICQSTMESFVRHNWSGNIRELKNAVERAVLFSAGNELQPYDNPSTHSVEQANGGREVLMNLAFEQQLSVPELVDYYVRYVHERLGGNKARTCDFLKINYRTLCKRTETQPVEESAQSRDR